jgi:hypothetical protein
MNITIRGATALTLAAALGGCAGLVTGGPLIRPGEPTGWIEVVNRSGRNIDAVLISDCDAASYGLNRLPSGTAIPSGGRYRFEVSAGCWDVDAGTFGYGEARQRMRIPAGGVQPYVISG